MTDLIPITEGVIEPERISPEGLEVANSYLVTNDVNLTAKELGLPRNMVADQLNDRLVRKYLDTVFMDTGYRNRNKLAETMDSVIERKKEEMEEAEISSSKDISELLAMAHKMRMDEMRMQMELLKLETAATAAKNKVVNTGPTVNIQDNSMSGSNYGQLMNQLLGLDQKRK